MREITNIVVVRIDVAETILQPPHLVNVTRLKVVERLNNVIRGFLNPTAKIRDTLSWLQKLISVCKRNCKGHTIVERRRQ